MTQQLLEVIAKNGCPLKIEGTLCIIYGKVCEYCDRTNCEKYMEYKLAKNKELQNRTFDRRER